MIEVLKQALHVMESVRVQVTSRERINKPYGEEWYDEAITSLQQAVKELESQEPVGWIDSKGNMLCVKINESCRPLYTNPPQRKPLTDGDFLDWYDSAIWGNEDFEQCCQIAFEAGWQFAHGIKE